MTDLLKLFPEEILQKGDELDMVSIIHNPYRDIASIPIGAEKIDEQIEYSLFRLSHIPEVQSLLQDVKDELEWDGAATVNPDLLAITDNEGAIRLVLLSLHHISNILDAQQALHETGQVLSTAYKNNHSLSRRNLPNRIPVVYDKQNKWLFLPLDAAAEDYLNQTSKSWGPSGTHYGVRKLNRFIDDLCAGEKIDDITYTDQLTNCEYYDVRVSPSEELFITRNNLQIPPGVNKGLELLKVKTLDQLPVFTGETSLASILSLMLGYNLDPNNLTEDHQLRQLMRASLGPDNLNRSIHLPEYSFHIHSLIRQSKEDDLLQALAATYDHREGFPVSAILCAAKPRENGRVTYHLLFGVDGHPAILGLAARNTLSRGPVSLYAFIDAQLFVRPEINPYTGIQFSLVPSIMRNFEGEDLPQDLQVLADQLIASAASASHDFGSQKYPVGVTLDVKQE